MWINYEVTNGISEMTGIALHVTRFPAFSSSENT